MIAIVYLVLGIALLVRQHRDLVEALRSTRAILRPGGGGL